MSFKKTLCRAALLGGLAASAIGVAPVRASDITFAVIGPHEYDLPVNFKDFNVFVQYGEYNDQNTAWDAQGNLHGVNAGNLFVGLSKYVRFFTIDGVPNIGFAWEVIVPEVAVDFPGGRVGGIGDPLTGPAVWFKPTKNSTLGFQTFLQMPIGANEVSNHYWDQNSSIFFDHQWQHVSLTGDLGIIFRSSQVITNSPMVNEPETGFFNLRVGWKNSTIIEPFVGFDWDATGVARYSHGGGVAVPASNEEALGVGFMANFNATTSLTLRYSHDVAGVNTIATNGAYLKFVRVF